MFTKRNALAPSVMPKQTVTINAFLTAPALGERCRILTKEGNELGTSPVVDFHMRSDGSGYIETRNSIYRTEPYGAERASKKTVMAEGFLSVPRIGDRCCVQLPDGRTILTSTVVSMSLNGDGSGYIETRNSVYVVEATGTVITG